MTSGVVSRLIGTLSFLSAVWKLEVPFSSETTPEVIDVPKTYIVVLMSLDT